MHPTELKSFIETLRAANIKQAAPGRVARIVAQGLLELRNGAGAAGRALKGFGSGAWQGTKQLGHDIADRGIIGGPMHSTMTPKRMFDQYGGKAFRSPLALGYMAARTAPAMAAGGLAAGAGIDALREKMSEDADFRRGFEEKIAQSHIAENLAESGSGIGHWLKGIGHAMSPTGFGEAAAKVNLGGFDSPGNARNAFGAGFRGIGDALFGSGMLHGSRVDRYARLRNATGRANKTELANKHVWEDLAEPQLVDPKTGRLPPPRGTPPMNFGGGYGGYGYGDLNRGVGPANVGQNQPMRALSAW